MTGAEDGLPNQGRLCVKGRFGYDFIYSEERLKTPLIREGDAFREASWDEALDEIAENFLNIKEKYGAKSVAFGVGMPKGLEHFILIRLANIFGSPNIIASQDVCAMLPVK